MPLKTKLPELLAPAGSPEALSAAIEGGADAVYFGSVRFSARMRARNFDNNEIADAIALCRAHGVKSYITVNTRLRDSEIEQLLETVSVLNGAGADALIIADLGAVSLIRERFPDLPLHASTQLSGVSARDASELSKLGFSRMVCPRELSIGQITSLCTNSPLEIEMFIHGAHCVSFSGQCMLSYAMGGRSGNRGECAQPCRLPYMVSGGTGVSKSQYPLSLKDMCLAEHIREILLSGVSSLKIEGRQKSPDYVWGVTKMYRALLDERRDATKDEMESLAALFSRDGFSDGYLKNRYVGMLGIRREVDTENSKSAESFGGLTKRVPISAHLTVKTGEPSSLSLQSKERTVTVTGVTPTEARTVPLTADSARKSIEKLGGTPFTLDSFTADIDDGLFMTPAQLNALRRDVITALSAPPARRTLEILKKERPRLNTHLEKPLYTAEFLSPGQIPLEAESFFDEIYLPLHCRQRDYSVALPEYAPDKRMGQLQAALSLSSPKSVLAHSPAQIALAKRMGIAVTASLRLNVFNESCADEIIQMGADAATLSPELPLGAMRAVKAPKSVIVYGRLPLMLTLRCAISDGGSMCRTHGHGGFMENDTVEKNHLCIASLKDRTGAAFPIVGMYDCSNIVYNSIPIYMADKQQAISSVGADRWHFLFTTESKKEAAEIIRAYKEGLAPRNPAAIRRLK